jgi:hypothetical protein
MGKIKQYKVRIREEDTYLHRDLLYSILSLHEGSVPFEII